MLTLNVTYEDFEGEIVEERFNFHLTKLELTEWDAESGGLSSLTEKISKSDKATDVLGFVEELVRRSFGVRRGNKFLKDADETEAFIASDAYSEMVFGFIENPVELLEFVKGILPKSISKDLDDSQIRKTLES